MALAVVFDHFTGGRNEFQFPSDILLTNQDHLRTAYRTNLLFFWKKITIFWPLKRSSCVAFFLRVCSLITVSSSNRDDSSFAGGTKEFFGQIIYLFLKNFLVTGFFVNNKTEKFDQLSLIQIPFFSCDIVSFSS